MYLEASGKQPGKTAKLESPVFTAVGLGKTCTITFAYHMYGADMGTLNVSVIDTGNNRETSLWSKSGNQGDRWYWPATATVPSSVSGSFKFVFTGAVGLSWKSDVAFDSVEFGDGCCKSQLSSVSVSMYFMLTHCFLSIQRTTSAKPTRQTSKRDSDHSQTSRNKFLGH
jgi:hypothetical protein